ncbi:MAG: DUF1801 domain-containing protein [Cellulomonas sp.]|nr:DUF1801 domain-containing protein [Cellulomonas sp.]
MRELSRAHRGVPRTIFASIDETISYQMPTVTLDGKYLVYVAAWKDHIGLYPVPPLSNDHHHAVHSPSS